MSQDQHFNVRDPGVPEALHDRKGTDMPSARTIIVVILATISAVVIFISIRYAIIGTGAKHAAPTEQDHAP